MLLGFLEPTNPMFGLKYVIVAGALTIPQNPSDSVLALTAC
jgi:hypothetical protein